MGRSPQAWIKLAGRLDAGRPVQACELRAATAEALALCLAGSGGRREAAAVQFLEAAERYEERRHGAACSR